MSSTARRASRSCCCSAVFRLRRTSSATSSRPWPTACISWRRTTRASGTPIRSTPRHSEAALEVFLQPETVQAIYTTGHRDLSRISPNNWNTDLFFLSRPHAHRVQLDLFYDYRTNAALYPTWQQSLRERQPLTPIFWGQGDIFFTPGGGEAYLRDLPDAGLVRLDSGHFAVEDSLQQISDGITFFYDTQVSPAVHAVTG